MMESIKVLPPKSQIIKKRLIQIAVVLYLAIILLLTYLPIVIIALTSFSTHTSGYQMPGVTLKWYAMLVQNKSLFKAITFTLEITFLSTIISTIFGTFTAIGINALNQKWRKRMIILNNVPILNADIVTAAFLLIIFQVLSIVFKVNLVAKYGKLTTLIAHILFSTPYVVLSVLPKLSKDEGLYEAALDLGCSPKEALEKVVLPNIKSGIFSGALLAFTMSIDDFIITYFVSGSNQNFSTWLYGNLRQQKNGQWNQACAYNTVLMFLTFAGVIIYQLLKSKREGKK
ncbi:MAG: ABC transporter permease [Anaeroplasmataceae bacterium]|nr:ABC transporter permease [Anaeroplasmataceae bacterium]MDE5868393.1 ABC transporter permease [Anaeroplasmataceae bacterium]